MRYWVRVVLPRLFATLGKLSKWSSSPLSFSVASYLRGFAMSRALLDPSLSEMLRMYGMTPSDAETSYGS